MRILCIFMTLLLSGCAKQAFDCPYKDGIRCKPLSEVDKQIDAGRLGANDKTTTIKKLALQPVPVSPLRTSEEVLTLWVAPYQTEDGTYHEERTLHFVAKPAEWIAATAIKSES